MSNGIMGLGIAADLIALVGAVLAVFKGLPKAIAWIKRRKYLSVASFTSSRPQNFRAAKEQLRSFQIAIVDDEPGSFPLDHLRAISGQVEVFERLELSTVDRLKKFDVVFLDITGVVPEDMRNGGIEVLKRLRGAGQLEPLVIAVSSKTFKPEVNKFFSLADDVLTKPLKAAFTENALLDLVAEKRTVNGIAKQCDLLISQSGKSSSDSVKIVASIVAYIEKSNNDIETLRRRLHKLHVSNGEQIVLQVDELKRRINEVS